jgi:hypothetical protein
LDGVAVQVRGLEDPGAPIKIHIEHLSGAALIVPECHRVKSEVGIVIETRGFDGTDYRLTLDEQKRTMRIAASKPSLILGDKLELELPRVEDLVATPAAAIRVTGDEVTMPIVVKR